MATKILVLLALGLVTLVSPCFATTHDSATFETSARALVFKLKDGAFNLGNCDGVYLVSNYMVNGRVVYVNEAKNRFLALNLPGYWTIGNLDFLPSIVASQSGTLQEQMEGGSFSGYHWASKNTQRDPLLSWGAYEVRAEDIVAVAFSRKNMHAPDPKHAEGVYGLSVLQVFAGDTPSVLGGTVEWSCDDDSCTKSNVYINYAKHKFLVQNGNGWVVDDMDNLENTLQLASNVNQELRQHNKDVTKGWESYNVAVSGYYSLDVEGNHPSASRRSGSDEQCTLDNWSECYGAGCCKPDTWTGKPYACHVQNEYYAQCIPMGECPEGWDCTILGHVPQMPGAETPETGDGSDSSPPYQPSSSPPPPPAVSSTPSEPASTPLPSASSSSPPPEAISSSTSSAPLPPSSSAPPLPVTTPTAAPATSTATPPSPSSTPPPSPPSTPAPTAPPPSQPAPVGPWGGRYVVQGEANGKPVYRNDQSNSVISFDTASGRWRESGAPLHRAVAEDNLLAGWAWETTPVSIVANYRLPELSTIEHPGLCEDLCVLNGGVPAPDMIGSGPRKCYFTPDAMRSWEGAEQFCEMHGGNLASIASEDDNEAVLSLFQDSVGHRPAWDFPRGERFWIGLSEEALGKWSWSDEAPFSYNNWSPNEPNNDSGTGIHEDCVEMRVWSSVLGEWNDLPCYSVQPFVCAKLYNPPPLSCAAQP